jgi:hypothetical protein
VIRAEVNKEAHRAYQVGDPVSVRYLPDNPQVSICSKNKPGFCTSWRD